MSIRDYPGLKSGCSAQLPSSYTLTARQMADASQRLCRQSTLSTSEEDSLRAETTGLDLPPCCWTIRIPDWWPTPLNQLINAHPMKAHRLKKTDAQLVALMAQRHGVPPAAGKRRVSITVVLPRGRRAVDPDALWKSLLDGLVRCGALRNDSSAWVEIGPVEFLRGERLCSYVTLEDLP